MMVRSCSVNCMLLYACGIDSGMPIVNVLVAVQEVILATEKPRPKGVALRRTMTRTSRLRTATL
jgi:hypothetical protein